MKLSVCMIVKNEAQVIRRCLDSVQDVADEIVIVDTGSTDNTLEICKQYTSHIYHFEWTGSFSDARNEALRYATSEWNMTLDADEFLDAEEKQGLRAFLESTDAEGVFVNVKNYLGTLSDMQGSVSLQAMRIFRAGHHYSGRIHEQIYDSVRATGKPVRQFDLTIHHIGYTSDFLQGRAKNDRNIQALEAELKDDPDNLFHRSNLVAEYMSKRDHHRAQVLAAETFKKIELLPKDSWPNFAPRVLIHWVVSEWTLEHHDEAKRICSKGIEYFPWYTDLKKTYAEILMHFERHVEAQQYLLECRQQGDVKNSLFETSEGVGTYLAAADLGKAWAFLGDEVVSRKWYLQAFLENTSLDTVIQPLVWLLPPDKSFLREHIESKINHPAVYAKYAEAYAVRGIEGADDLLSRVERQCGASELTTRARMAVLRRQNPQLLLEYVERFNYEYCWYLLGIHYLDVGLLNEAHEALSKGGKRGEYVWQVHHLLSTTDNFRWGTSLVLTDMLSMEAKSLLTAWLPHALDLHETWIAFKYSRLQTVLTSIEWSGNHLFECEHNALKYFQTKDFARASQWLERSKQFGRTVTQVLLGIDLALSSNDIKTARAMVYEAKFEFPESEVLKNVSEMLHPKVDPVQLKRQLEMSKSTRGVR